MRLIDADALKEQILDWISEQVVSKYISHDACMATREGARVAFNLLNDAPTIDAVPVVRGEWIQKHHIISLDNVTLTGTYPTCNLCDYAEVGMAKKSNYCPNCGCDMRGERDGEK